MSKKSSSSGCAKNSACRSLFDDNSVTPNRKRKRSSESTLLISPRENKRQRRDRTPREERKRRSAPFVGDEKSTLGCTRLYTPNKRDFQSPSTKSLVGSANKLGTVKFLKYHRLWLF